jgi:hypothetical protein
MNKNISNSKPCLKNSIPDIELSPNRKTDLSENPTPEALSKKLFFAKTPESMNLKINSNLLSEKTNF